MFLQATPNVIYHVNSHQCVILLLSLWYLLTPLIISTTISWYFFAKLCFKFIGWCFRNPTPTRYTKTIHATLLNYDWPLWHFLAPFIITNTFSRCFLHKNYALHPFVHLFASQPSVIHHANSYHHFTLLLTLWLPLAHPDHS